MLPIYLINLDEFSSKEELNNFVLDMNFPYDDTTDCLWDIKTGVCTGYRKVSKVWLSKDVFRVIAYQDTQGQKFTLEFLDFLEKMEPIKSGGIPIFEKKIASVKSKESQPIPTLDEILDKINVSGIDSLTDEEKEFLSNQ